MNADESHNFGKACIEAGADDVPLAYGAVMNEQRIRAVVEHHFEEELFRLVPEKYRCILTRDSGDPVRQWEVDIHHVVRGREEAPIIFDSFPSRSAAILAGLQAIQKWRMNDEFSTDQKS